MSYKFFENRECEFFPCHRLENGEEFNCLFCYCPLYALGKECGGNPVFLENGVKDCTLCTFPHKKQNYEKVIELLHKKQPERLFLMQQYNFAFLHFRNRILNFYSIFLHHICYILLPGNNKVVPFYVFSVLYDLRKLS